MNYSHELEFKIIVENLANTFVNIGITEADVNRATVKLRKYLKNIDVLEEQDKPGFFQKAGDFLKGLTSRVGLTHATSPAQLDQQRKAVVAAVKNYMGSLGNAGITNAVKIFAPVLRDINTWHAQALRTKAFGGPGKAGAPAAPGAPPAGTPGTPPAAPGTPPAAPGTPPAAPGTPPAAPGTPAAAPGTPAAPAPIPQEKIDAAKQKVYGGSGTGKDGDYSGFPNPEAAKTAFLKGGPDYYADPTRFAQLMTRLGYKESASHANKYSFSKFVESRRV
jgi:hypothetical protein